MTSATLFVFAGLPGAGKSTLARMLSSHKRCVYVRIDTIEQALRDLCSIDVAGEGYRLAYRVAADNLALGCDVVADSCNPIDLTRTDWVRIAEKQGCSVVNIEVVCSDPDEHRRRAEGRTPDVAGLALPSWEQIVEREYHSWDMPRIRLDTAGKAPEASLLTLLELLGDQPA